MKVKLKICKPPLPLPDDAFSSLSESSVLLDFLQILVHVSLFLFPVLCHNVQLVICKPDKIQMQVSIKAQKESLYCKEAMAFGLQNLRPLLACKI